MRLVFVSGLSGSGKSVALHMLEDLDFYCVDNIPAALLKPFISHTVRSNDTVYRRTAIGIDARNTEAEIATWFAGQAIPNMHAWVADVNGVVVGQFRSGGRTRRAFLPQADPEGLHDRTGSHIG